MAEYEKFEKDGQVAVLYSPGYGSGWYTWNKQYPGLLFDKEIVEAVLNNDYNLVKEIARQKYPDGFFDGADTLKVKWLSKNTKFIVEEYDGSESILTEFIVA